MISSMLRFLSCCWHWLVRAGKIITKVALLILVLVGTQLVSTIPSISFVCLSRDEICIQLEMKQQKTWVNVVVSVSGDFYDQLISFSVPWMINLLWMFWSGNNPIMQHFYGSSFSNDITVFMGEMCLKSFLKFSDRMPYVHLCCQCITWNAENHSIAMQHHSSELKYSVLG
jgi:hypothetical protein